MIRFGEALGIPYFCCWQIVLQKSPSGLCEIEICNDEGTGTQAGLNDSIAFPTDLGSMLRDKMLKILLRRISAISVP